MPECDRSEGMCGPRHRSMKLLIAIGRDLVAGTDLAGINVFDDFDLELMVGEDVQRFVPGSLRPVRRADPP